MHAAIAPLDALQRERRGLYQLAIELLAPGSPQPLDPDVIDSPLARHRIGDALAGRTRLLRSTLVGISALAATSSGTQNPRVASRPEAKALLAEALDTVGLELDRQQAACRQPELLTHADGERFTSALAVLRKGVALARSASSELIEDLLAHVALVGIIDPLRAGRLASASPRTFPGLVLLKGPASAIEVAEALVHEGAHQKLFDLAITRDLLNADSDRCPPFHPPWAPEERRWPLEQALAAWHAYACLARFAHGARVMAGQRAVGPDSLLPVANERSKLIGQWLLDNGDYLGSDAHWLLDGLIGRRPRASRAVESWPGPAAAPVVSDYVIDTPLELRRCGSPDRVLVGRPSRPPQLYWVSDDAAVLLELLGRRPLDEVVTTFAQRWGMQRLEATHQLTTMLTDLSVSGLVTTRGTTAVGQGHKVAKTDLQRGVPKPQRS
ncbi:MAG: HEXXH motif-containing putative peptide modification protein [Actinomycetota bacterium]|nr:HEXXH motif-containing putative peptide modification protein [Actinomycetota bacterium]